VADATPPILPVAPYLRRILETNASDVYLTAGSPPVYRVEGIATPTDEPALTPADTAAIAVGVMNERQRAEFETEKEMNLALSIPGEARFRCNLFQQRGSVGLVIRQIKESTPTLAGLGLPPILGEISLGRRGLVLVVGATGSGKSTTLAAMIDHRNTTSSSFTGTRDRSFRSERSASTPFPSTRRCATRSARRRT
jgi:twitching motility protein PilU